MSMANRKQMTKSAGDVETEKAGGGQAMADEEGQLAITNAVSALKDILTALQGGDNLQAEALAEYLRDFLANEGDKLRAEALTHVQAWITANANGLKPAMYELVGLRPDPRSPKEEAQTSARY